MSKWLMGIFLFFVVWIGSMVYLLNEDLTINARSAIGVAPTSDSSDFRGKNVSPAQATSLSPGVPTGAAVSVSGTTDEEGSVYTSKSDKSSLAECLKIASAKETENLKKYNDPESSSRNWAADILNCLTNSTKNPGGREELQRLLSNTKVNFVAKVRWLIDLAKEGDDYNERLRGRLSLLKQFSDVLKDTAGDNALPPEWEDLVAEAARIWYTKGMRKIEESITKKDFSRAWNRLRSLEKEQQDIAEEFGVGVLPSDTATGESILAAQKAIADDVLLEKSEDVRHYLAKGNSDSAFNELDEMRKIMETIHESPSSEFVSFYQQILIQVGEAIVVAYEQQDTGDEPRKRLPPQFIQLSPDQKKRLVTSDLRIEEMVNYDHAMDVERALADHEDTPEEKVRRIANYCKIAPAYWGVTRLHPACGK